MQDAPTLFSKLQPNIPTSTASFPEGPTWIKNKIPGLDNRTHHALILVDHLMIIISKPDSTQIVQSFTPKPSPCFAIDLKKNVWRNVIVQGVPYQREGHTICAYKENEFLMYGGQTPESQTFFGKTPAGISSELCVLKLLNKNELILECKLKYENDPARPSQIAKASSGPARAYHTANIYNGRMYIFGGIEKIDSTTATNSVHFVNIETGIWESPQVQGDIPEPRSGHCSVLYKDQIYIFGGINQPSPNKDIFVFNIANNSWRKVESKGVSPQLKAHGVAHQINGKAYFFGAQNALSVGEGDGLFTLDLDSFTWNAVKTQGVVEYPRIGHKSVIYNGGLVIFGGNSGDPSVYSIALPENILSSTSVQGGIAKTQKPADTSKGQASIFVQDLGKMFMDSTFSDVTFTVKGQSIPAHKNILAMRCPHFVSMFSSSEGTQLSKVEITDVDPKTFKAVIEFAYCNQVELDVDLALDVLKLSHKYKFSSLKQICSEYLSGKLSIDNYVAIASASEEYQAPVLEDAVLEFVSKNLKSIEQKREYPNLSKEIFWKIILKLGKK